MPSKRRAIQVPFDKIVADPDFNCRKEYHDIDELAKSILDEGLMQALGVRAEDDGTYFLVYGFRRYYAIKKLRERHGGEYYEEVDVMLNDGVLEELRIRNLKENMDRRELTPYEISQQIKRMVQGGWNQDDIASKLGQTQSLVSNMYKVATKLSMPAQNAFREGDITFGYALELAAIDEAAQPAVVEKLLQAETKTERRRILKDAYDGAGKKRTYATKGRPSRKDMLEMIAEASYTARSQLSTKNEMDFYNGLAAGMRLALGDTDVDYKKLKPTEDYADPNYHKRNAKTLTAETEAADAAQDKEEAADGEDDDTHTGEIVETPDEEENLLAADFQESHVEPDPEASQEEEYAPFKPRETIKGIAAPAHVDQGPPKKKRGRPPKNKAGEKRA